MGAARAWVAAVRGTWHRVCAIAAGFGRAWAAVGGNLVIGGAGVLRRAISLEKIVVRASGPVPLVSMGQGVCGGGGAVVRFEPTGVNNTGNVRKLAAITLAQKQMRAVSL